MMTALHIFHVDGAIEDRTADLPERPSLAALHALCDPIVGGVAEHVTVLGEDGPQDLFVHETGVNDGLPLNPNATALYRRAWLSRNPDADPDSLPYVAGVAVAFGRRVWS